MVLSESLVLSELEAWKVQMTALVGSGDAGVTAEQQCMISGGERTFPLDFPRDLNRVSSIPIFPIFSYFSALIPFFPIFQP